MLQGDLLNWPTESAPVRATGSHGDAELSVVGTIFTALASGALWQSTERTLIIADLHLEKGSAFARRGQLLPPYDTAATLAALSVLVFRLNPARVIALGDSFHDNDGAQRLHDYDRSALAALQRGREWIWIAGNHDDELPDTIGGERAEAVTLGPVTLRHLPSYAAPVGEIAGHLHPAARVAGRAGSVRRRCFVGDGTRLVMPAFGAYAGGLNVLEPVVASLFAGAFTAFVLGKDAVYPVSQARLCAG